MTYGDPGSHPQRGTAPFRHLAGTVLVVDDDVDLLDGLARGLRHANFRLLTASDAREALAMAGREAVDVVVSDLRMPGMDGLELLDLIHERRPDAVRILMTGHPSAESAIDAINHGEVFRYLTKPVGRDLLEATLTVAFGRLAEERARALRASPSEPPASSRAVATVSLLTEEERLALREASHDLRRAGARDLGWPARRR